MGCEQIITNLCKGALLQSSRVCPMGTSSRSSSRNLGCSTAAGFGRPSTHTRPLSCSRNWNHCIEVCVLALKQRIYNIHVLQGLLRHKADIWIIFFCPLLEKFCPPFKHFTQCPVRVHFAQTVVHFTHFQVQARKRGVLGWGWACFVYVHIPERGLWLLSHGKEQGLVMVFWAKWDPIRAKWKSSGQFVWKVGESTLELGKKIQSQQT